MMSVVLNLIGMLWLWIWSFEIGASWFRRVKFVSTLLGVAYAMVELVHGEREIRVTVVYLRSGGVVYLYWKRRGRDDRAGQVERWRTTERQQSARRVAAAAPPIQCSLSPPRGRRRSRRCPSPLCLSIAPALFRRHGRITGNSLSALFQRGKKRKVDARSWRANYNGAKLQQTICGVCTERTCVYYTDVYGYSV